MRFASFVSSALVVVLGACAAPPAEEDTYESTRFDGLTENDAEAAAAAFLAHHDALGTDFERLEGEGAAPRADVETRGLRTSSVAEDLSTLASTPGTWAYEVVRVSPTGEKKTLASSNAERAVMGASTFKLFTGWTAFANKAAGSATLTTMLRMSDNRLAQLVMCQNGEKLGRWDAPCVARENPTTAMRMPDAIRASEDFLARDGVRLSSSFDMRDGAGLVEAATLSVDDLVTLLLRIHRDPRAPTFRGMLAQPGVSSTLRSRFRGLEGKLFAKTGTYNDWGGGVKALAGYAMLPSRATLVFAVIGNGVGDANRAMTAIERAMTDVIAHADAER